MDAHIAHTTDQVRILSPVVTIWTDPTAAATIAPAVNLYLNWLAASYAIASCDMQRNTTPVRPGAAQIDTAPRPGWQALV